MGNLTTVVLHNDAMGSFRKDPKAFGEAILKAIDEANNTRMEATTGIDGYANYITAHPSRHADDSTLYLHHGNTVTDLNAWCKDFQDLRKRLPNVAKDFVKVAKRLLKSTEESLKKPVDIT